MHKNNDRVFVSCAADIKKKMGSIPQLSILKGPVRASKPTLLHKIFDEVANTAANSTAVIFEDNGKPRKSTYMEVNNLANRLSRVIRQTIFDNSLSRNNDGDFIVAVSMRPSDYLVVILLAIWKAGGAYLPLDQSFPKARVEHILNEAKPAIVIFDEDTGNFANTFKISLNEFFDSTKDVSSNPLSNEERLEHLKDELAIVLYTSGSTGVPKGVRLLHTTILNRLQWQFKNFPYSKTETTGVFKTPLTFLDSVGEIWGPLLNGLALLVVPKATTQNPEKLIAVLEKNKIERIVLVPSLLKSLLICLNLQRYGKFLQSLKTWVCSGETLAVSLAEEFYKYFSEDKHKLCNFYGSTEIMADVTFHIISGLDELRHQEKIPIGLPIDNTIIYLLDAEFRPVKAGEVGELFVAGSNLAAGYVNGRDPDKFIENPFAVEPLFAKLYRTGDFARLENGTLLYEGRTDAQIKVRGHRVDLSEVEKAVNAIDGIDKGVVLCYKPGDVDQAILAFVTTRTSSLNEYQIELVLKKHLVAYMVPLVILIDSIPLSTCGKTDRQALLQSYELSNSSNNDNNQTNIDYSGVPQSQMPGAKVLFETVASSVLNRSARSIISLNANFYEIGGNSLNSILTISRLNQRGYHISIGDFIASINLGEILNRMSPEKQFLQTTSVQPASYKAEVLQDKHKNDVIDMITTSFCFCRKEHLKQWCVAAISESAYTDLVDVLWEPLMEKQLSFVVKSEAGKAVGVALSFDARDKPKVKIYSKLAVVFEFLESIEGPVRDLQLPAGKGQVLHSFMMGTKSTLTPKENIAVIQFMEEEVIRLAKSKKFIGIFATNTSPLTQQLGSDIYGYKTCLDYQVNEYVASDNTKPFGMAPDSERALVQWKVI